MVDHLTDIAPPKTDPHYKRWTVEEEVLYTWILDSMSTEMANRFIEYATVKEIWDAVHYFHSKKNNRSKIAQLVTKAWTLQQGDRSLINYANELSAIFSELDQYRPPISSSGDGEYILTDRVYKLLQGLRPEFEGIRGQMYNRENPLTFDEAVAQLLGEESRLLEMKGGETTAYTVTQPGNSATTQHGTNLPNNKKGPMRNKENL